jgi:hypothetical protein
LIKKEVRRKAEYIVSGLADAVPMDILPFYRIHLFYGMLYTSNPGLDKLMSPEIMNRVTGRYEMWVTLQENFDPTPAFLAALLDGCRQTAWDRRFLSLNQKLDEGLARVYTFPVVEAVQRLARGEALDDAFLVGVFGDAKLARLLRWAMALKRDAPDCAAILDLADERHFLNRHRFRVSEVKLLWGIRERKVNLKEAWALLKAVVPAHLLEVLLTVLAFDNQLPTDALFEVYPQLLASSELFGAIGVDSFWSWVALLLQKGEFALARTLLGSSGSYSRLSDSHTMESLVTDLAEVRQATAIVRRNEHLLRPTLDRRQLGARELVATFSPGLPRPLQYNPSLFLMLHCGDSHAEAVAGKVWRHGFGRAGSFLFFYLYLNLRNYRAFKLEFLFDLLFFRTLVAHVDARRRSDPSFAVPRDMLAAFDAKLAQLTAAFDQMFRNDRLFVPYRRLRERLSAAEQLLLSRFLEQARADTPALLLLTEEQVVHVLLNRELLARWKARVEDPEVRSILDTVFRSHDVAVPLTHYFFERPDSPELVPQLLGQPPFLGGFLAVLRNAFAEAVHDLGPAAALPDRPYPSVEAGVFILLLSRKLARLERLPNDKAWSRARKTLLLTSTLFGVVDKALFFEPDTVFRQKFSCQILYLLSMGICLYEGHTVTFSNSLFGLDGLMFLLTNLCPPLETLDRTYAGPNPIDHSSVGITLN